MAGTTKRNTNAKRRLFGQAEEVEPQDALPPRTTSVSTGSASSSERSNTNLVLDTPQKINKKQKSNHDFFSPKGKPVVTPDKIEDDDDDIQVVSPPLKKSRLSARYSPEKKEQEDKIVEEEAYVPTYIHQNLSYNRKGVASLAPKIQTTYQLIVDHYDVPKDFEHNRTYGPLSGTSHEERVLSAYNLSLLEAKSEVVEICSHCATVGHKRNDCVDLI